MKKMDVFPLTCASEIFITATETFAIELADCCMNCLLERSIHKWLFQNEEAQHLRYLYKFRMVLLIENLGDQAPGCST